MSNYSQIKRLAKLYAEYNIYPKKAFLPSKHTMFGLLDTANTYTEQVRFLLAHQYLSSTRLGADLPWWGRNYFSNEKGIRVMVISEDSRTIDAGGIALHANYMANGWDYTRYLSIFRKGSKGEGLEIYRGWQNMKAFLDSCHLNWDFVFVTNARKVFPVNSIKDKAFIEEERNHYMLAKDRSLDSAYDYQLTLLKESEEDSKSLLFQEINECNPDIILCLGKVPFAFLNSITNYRRTSESRNTSVPILTSEVFPCKDFVAAPNQGISHVHVNSPFIISSINTFRKKYRHHVIHL